MVLVVDPRTDTDFPPYAEHAMTVLHRRYLKKDEEEVVCEHPDDMFWRVAMNLAEADGVFGATPEQILETAREFYAVMRRFEFLPNSPTLMNAGRDLQQLSACFVLPIEDNLDDIMTQVKQTALIHKSGGGTGFSFSSLRPMGDMVKTTGGVASGPTSFILLFDATTDVVKQGGTRRGANMGVLSVRHPDILEFIRIKNDGETLQNFNISIGVDDEFMRCVEQGLDYELVNPRNLKVTGTLPARDVWTEIVEGAWQTGDPGVLFMDRINEFNPNPQIAKVEATNPCGEATLLPYESCNLGSVNLGLMVSEDEDGRLRFDEDKLRRVVFTAVHLLDNVIEKNDFPLTLIEERTRSTRRIGVGVMGFADLLVSLGIRYDSEAGLDMAERAMGRLNELVVEASRDLAEKRDPFPEFHRSLYAERGEPPRRNSAPTTIAPTGTISRIAGASSGIEPLFALSHTSEIMDGTRLPQTYEPFLDYARAQDIYTPELEAMLQQEGFLQEDAAVPDYAREVFRVAHQIAPEWHVRMQAAFQKHCESAVSKTVNMPGYSTREQVSDIYFLAFRSGCKGVTVYRDGSKVHQVLSLGTDPTEAGDGELLQQDGDPSVHANGNGHANGHAKDAAGPLLRDASLNGQTNGVNGNGAYPNGAHPDGAHPNGVRSNGSHFNGAHFNESRPSPALFGLNGRGEENENLPQVMARDTSVLSPRKRLYSGTTQAIATGHGNGYFTVNQDDDGRIIEVFANVGKAGRCDDVEVEALTRMVSLYLRSGGDPREVIKQLSGHTCCPVWDQGRQVNSIPDAIAIAIEDAMNQGIPGQEALPEAVQPALMDGQTPVVVGGRSGRGCPICGGVLAHEEGCRKCYACDWSSCG